MQKQNITVTPDQINQVKRTETQQDYRAAELRRFYPLGKLALTIGFQRPIAEIMLSTAGWGGRPVCLASDETTVSSQLIHDADNASFSVHTLVTSDTVQTGRPTPIWMLPPMQACAEWAFSPGRYRVTFKRPDRTPSCWTRWLPWTHRGRCQLPMLQAELKG